jgi:hypothetical protein
VVVEGVDYSYDPPSPDGLAAAGKRFAVRYGALGNPGKLLTAAEVKALTSAGLGIVANVEETAQALRGAAAGIRHAAAGDAFFQTLGMPADRPVYFSVDWDAGPGDWPDIDAALRGAASMIGPDRVGVYGSYATVAHCATAGTARWFWQTYAWSAGRWHSACHLQQYKNNVALAGGTVDLTRAVQADYGQWGGATVATSQNGWPVDEAGTLQDRTAVAGVTFPNGIRSGDVYTVLAYVAEAFHRTVEPLVPGTCWGWYVKTISGSTQTSNHASGTAIDLNAPAHPLGVPGTFSPAQVTAIRKIVDYCGGVVRWGGDYTSRKDEMHFEINKDGPAVAALAAKIKGDDDMPVTDTDVEKIAAGVWARNLPSTWLSVQTRSAGDWIKYADACRRDVAAMGQSLGAAIQAVAAKDTVDEQALAAALAPGVAAAVLAALPDSADPISQDEVTTAVKEALRDAFSS